MTEMRDRNRRIVRAINGGESIKSVAGRFGISRTRVRQIYNLHMDKRGGAVAHMVYRMRYLPDQISNTRRKLAMLENEARRYGMHDILQQQETPQ